MRFSLLSFRAALAGIVALLLVGAGLVAAPAAFAAPGQTVTLGFVNATESVSEGSGGMVGAVVIITSDNDPLEAPVTFTFSHTGGAATNGDDFLLPAGTMTFTAATPINTPLALVTVNNDSTVEANETLQLSLTNVTGATLAQATTTITINNDDVATVTVADMAQAEGNAGTSTMTFTVQVDRAVQGGFALDYETVNVTATAGSDYTATSGTLSFAGTANESHTVAVTIAGDTTVEANETFRLFFPQAVASVAPGGIDITDTATGTITNDDGATVTIGDVSVTEGNAGTTVATFTATLNAAVPGGFTVNYATANGTATTADGDYVAATGSLAFAGTATETQTFSVTVNGDSKLEADETFTVSLNTVSNSAVDITDTATGTITNDDTASVTIADVSVTEGNAGTSNMIFTVSLDNAVQGGFTVNYATTDGTATTADNDYVAATGILTFTGTASQTRTFVVTINGDTKVEADETFTVSLNTVSNSAVNITDTATGTINNNDTAAITVASVAQAEGNAGTSTMTFTVALNNAVQGGFTVDYATTAVTATAGTDYATATGTLTFAGTTNETRTIAVTVNGDTVLEPNETFTVAFTSVSNALVNIADTAVGTINNDDSAAVTIANASQAEGNAGTSTMTFTATLDNAVQGGFTVNYATANGTANAGSDYAAATGTLTFAGTVGETQNFTVTINGDTLVEPDETLIVSLNTVSNANVTITDTATGTITNDDSAFVTIGDVSIVEGNAGTTAMTFTATLNGSAPGAFTVPFSTSDGSANAGSDFILAGGTLSFSGTDTETRTFTVSVYGDTVVEGDETFTVSMGSASISGVTTADTATGTITNDDSAAVTISNVGQSEGDAGTSLMTFTAQLDSTVQGGFTVNYATANGAATTADNDYVAATGTLTFAGGFNEVQTFTVTINGDTAVEPNEAFVVSMNSSSHPDVVVSDTANGIILNDDTGSVTIADASIAEGNAGTSLLTFTATNSNAVAGGFTVNYATSNGSAIAGSDYAAATGTLTFAGGAGETQQFTVTINGDTAVEPDETFDVTLNTVSNTDVIITGIATGTITNDDTASVTIADASISEGNTGTPVMTFTATLNGSVSTAFTVPFSTAGVSAAAGSDFILAAGTLSFSGTANETRTFAVSVYGDTIVEGDETFTVSMGAASNTDITTTDTATGTILNDDTASVTVADASATEGSPVTFAVVLGNAVQGGVDVPWQLTAGTAGPTDLTLTSGTLGFAGTATEELTITVPTVADGIVENDETFTLSLGTASVADVDTSDTATGTIVDDDVLTASLTILSATTPENGGAIGYSIVLNASIPAASSLDVAVSYSGAAVGGTDYTAGGTIIGFGPGSSGGTFTLPTIDDGLLEGDENLTITLTGLTVGGAPFRTALGTATGSATITDDETTTVEIVADDATATEGSSALRTFTARLGLVNNTAAPIVISYTVGGTASSSDVAALSGTVAIPVGSDRATIAIAPLADALVEGDETLILTIASASLAAVALGAVTTATMTILDATTTPAAALAGTGVEPWLALAVALLLLAVGAVVLRRRALLR